MRVLLFVSAFIIGTCQFTGCGGGASPEAPSANEYEAYIAENPEAAEPLPDMEPATPE